MFSFWSLLASGVIHIAPFFLASFVRFGSLACFWAGSFLLTLSCLLVGLLFAVEAHHSKREAAGVMAQRGGGPAALQWRFHHLVALCLQCPAIAQHGFRSPGSVVGNQG